MAQVGNTDMYSVFLELEFAGEWDATPSKAVAVIAGLYPLYSRILRMCRNGVLPRERMRTALCNLDNRMGIFHARFFPKGGFSDSRPTVEVAHTICEIIQVGADMLRGLKKSSATYLRSMTGLTSETSKVIDELIDMMTLHDWHPPQAMAHAMDVLEQVPSGAVGRPLQPDSRLTDLTWEQYCDMVEPDPEENPCVMRSFQSNDDIAEEIRGTQTPAGDANSSTTDEAVEPEPAGVDTAHALLPVKPHWDRPRRNGKWISRTAAGIGNCTDPGEKPMPLPAKAKKKPGKKIGSTARSKLVAYSKLVRRVREARVQKRGLHQEIGDRRRKYCEAAYRRRLTRRVVSDGGTVGEQLAGHRKAARKAYVKAGREFDLILRGPM